MTDVIKVILAIILFPFAVFVAIVFLVAHAIGQYINDIYDDDIYWGGKD